MRLALALAIAVSLSCGGVDPPPPCTFGTGVGAGGTGGSGFGGGGGVADPPRFIGDHVSATVSGAATANCSGALTEPERTEAEAFDPHNAALAPTATSSTRRSSSTGLAEIVSILTFDAKVPGWYHLVARWEPNLGGAQNDVLFSVDRRGGTLIDTLGVEPCDALLRTTRGSTFCRSFTSWYGKNGALGGAIAVSHDYVWVWDGATDSLSRKRDTAGGLVADPAGSSPGESLSNPDAMLATDDSVIAFWGNENLVRRYDVSGTAVVRSLAAPLSLDSAYQALRLDNGSSVFIAQNGFDAAGGGGGTGGTGGFGGGSIGGSNQIVRICTVSVVNSSAKLPMENCFTTPGRIAGTTGTGFWLAGEQQVRFFDVSQTPAKPNAIGIPPGYDVAEVGGGHLVAAPQVRLLNVNGSPIAVMLPAINAKGDLYLEQWSDGAAAGGDNAFAWVSGINLVKVYAR